MSAEPAHRRGEATRVAATQSRVDGQRFVIGTAELANLIRDRAKAFGLEVVAFGIRDLILPGEMKAILNRVTEAKKVAEADLITRREETAAMRSQANTASIFESNPALMRLRELEVVLFLLALNTTHLRGTVLTLDRGVNPRCRRARRLGQFARLQ